MRRYRIESFVHVLKLSPERRAAALRRMKEKLGELPPAVAAKLMPILERALRAQEETVAALDRREAAKDDVMHADVAKMLDAKLDKVLSMLDQALEGFIELFDGQHAVPAKKIREAIFPEGVIGITRRPFIEQHERLLLLLNKLRSAELAQAVSALQLGFWVDRIQQLTDEYGAALTQPDRVDFEAVRTQNTAAWVDLVEVVAAVIALYPTNKPADIEGRQLLLKPLVDQEEEAALLRARRRHGTPGGKARLEDELDTLDEEDVLEPGDEPLPAEDAA